jgi:aspartyl-tRNA(Asn)/glutamyl-tRNA(Gln) amidotransferase subunit A
MTQLPSALDLARGTAAGTYRATEITEAALERIRSSDSAYRAFVETWPESALQAAAAIDAARDRGEALGPLAGVPVALKDNLVRKGHVTAAGSRMLETFRSPYTATAVARLERAGAVLLGRTNMDEFGMGSSTERSAFFATRNPWNSDHVPGGSSGGSAAAVALDFAPLAIGSDTGGSVRQPAALCGVTGLKPTYGRISRSGLIAYASSLDCVGGLARTAGDLALLLQVLAGHDPADPTSLDEPVPDYAAALAQRRDLSGLTLGLPWELNGPGLDADVERICRAAVDTLRSLGARVQDRPLPHIRHAVPTYYLVATAEASSNLARYDGIRFGLRREGARRVEDLTASARSHGFGPEVQLRILLGTFALQAGYQEQFYLQATKVRTLLRDDFRRAFQSCDLIVCPTSPVPAFPLGSRLDDPLAMYLCDALTVPASLAGLPALSMPCGFTEQGLPVGLQLCAPALREDLLLQTAHVFQAATNWHLRRPRA